MKMMNKLLLLLIVSSTLILIQASPAEAACCFRPSQTAPCEEQFQGDEASCNQIGGTFDFSDDCSGLIACEKHCGCQNEQPIFARKHFFTTQGTPSIETVPEACIPDFCTGAMEACKDNCEENEGDCITQQGIIDATSKFYCFDTKLLYNFQSDCITDCIPPIPACTKGATVQSTLETQQIASCLCAGIERTTGVCCSSGEFETNIADCAPANKCSDQGNVCATACQDTAFPLFDFDVNDPETCSATSPKCCEAAAPPLGDCCNQFESCDGQVLTASYTDCSVALGNTPCSTTCNSPPDCQEGFQINAGINDDNEFTHCLCSGQERNIATDAGFCCAGNTFKDANSGGCITTPLGTISGVITDGATTLPVAGANVELKSGGIVLASATTATDGAFTFQDREHFTYLVVAQAQGFRAGVATAELTSPTLTTNIALQPFSSANCDSITPPAPDNLQANPTKGEEIATLSWNSQCTTANYFLITRIPAHPLGTIITASTSFEDKNVTWGTVYDYTVRSHHTQGAVSEPATISITLGNKLCEGITDDTEFCLNATQQPGALNTRAFECDNNNNLDFKSSCPTGSQCTGPDNFGQTRCKEIEACEESDGQKPFGLFYEQESCEGQNGGEFCYYDYTQTSVDACKDCGTNTCFDYLSQEACLKDQCGAGARITSPENYHQGCSYLNLWPEFAKGLCYDPDFEEDRCDQCNRQAGIFNNINCDQTVCSALGSCFSDTQECNSCTETTRCEDFNTQATCIAAAATPRSFTIIDTIFQENIPFEILPSNDACNLERCRWETTTSACFKDGDANTINDCPDIEGIPDESCKRDHLAPNTLPKTDIPPMNKEGFDIVFSSDADADKFYYCISQTNCKPTTELAFVTGEVSLNPITTLTDTVGTYNLVYYTRDTSDNLEQVKSVEFFIDTIEPTITITPSSNPTTATTSEISIVAESDELVECTISTDPVIPVASTLRNDFNQLTKERTFTFTANNLEDGIITATVACKDDVNNIKETILAITTDAVKAITLTSPDFDTLQTSAVNLIVETTDSAACTLTRIASTPETITLTQQSVTTNKFRHTTTKTVTTDDSFRYQVICLSTLSGLELDRGNILFTVDTTPPITTVAKGGSPFDASSFHRTPFDLELACEDPDQGSSPGEFGCSTTDIRFCTGAIDCIPTTHTINPESVSVTGDATSHLRFFSEDTGTNREVTKDILVKVDNQAPTLIVNTFTAITNLPTIIVGGSAFDTLAGIEKIEIRTVKGSDISQRRDLITITTSTFNQQLTLFDGVNIIIITAIDNAGNRKENTITITKDVSGPVIIPRVLDQDLVQVDSNQLILPTIPRKDATFLEDLNFAAAISDSVGIASASVTLSCLTETQSFCGTFSQTTTLTTNGTSFTGAIANIAAVGNFTAAFTATDDFGNPNTETVKVVIQDNTEPEFTLSIFADSAEVNEVGFDLHEIRVTATEELSDLTINVTYVNRFSEVVKTQVTMTSTNNIDWTGTFNIDDILSNQNIDTTFKIDAHAKDINENVNEVINSRFRINTLGPQDLTFTARIPGTIFEPQLTIKGFVEEGSTVFFDVRPCPDATLVGCGSPVVSQVTSETASIPQGIVDKSIRSHFEGGLPQEGDSKIFFDGEDLTAIPGTFKFIDFEPRDASVIPRYEINSINVVPSSGVFPAFTEIGFTPPLEFSDDVIPTLTGFFKMSLFDKPTPPKYFENTITLAPGFNKVAIVAEKDAKRSETIINAVNFDTEKFTIVLSQPSDGIINFNDFANANSKVAFSVNTLRNGALFDTDCTLSHTQADVVAGVFSDVAMETVNNKVHTFTTDTSSCKENGGNHFLVGNTPEIPEVANRYTISCTASNTQIGTVTTDVCFTTATFAAVGTEEFGRNICTSPIPPVTIPVPCAGGTSTIFGGDDGSGTGGDSGGDDSGTTQTPTGDINIIFT